MEELAALLDAIVRFANHPIPLLPPWMPLWVAVGIVCIAVYALHWRRAGHGK